MLPLFVVLIMTQAIVAIVKTGSLTPVAKRNHLDNQSTRRLDAQEHLSDSRCI